MKKPLVSISCITYNHEPFIRQCIDGFLMQKCDFDFEILIHDDASTDGTQDIIREYHKKYPKIIKPILQVENQLSKGVSGINRTFNFPRAKGKYIALCDGDDYWIDPFKLQKQVDFLETNPEYGFAHTNYTVISEEGEVIPRINRIFPSGDVNKLILNGRYHIATLTTIFRRNLLQSFPASKYYGLAMGDLPLWLEFSRISKVKYFPNNTATYRLLINSASQSKDISKVFLFKCDSMKIKKIFAQSYNIEFSRSKAKNKLLYGMVKEAYFKNDKKMVEKYFKMIKNNSIFEAAFIKTILFYYGAKNKLIDRLIKFIYSILK